MTELRKRMIECFSSKATLSELKIAKVRAVRQLTEYYRKPPDLITEEELRQYFLYI